MLFALVQVTPAGVVTGSAYVNTGDGAWLRLTGSVRGTTVKLVLQCSGGGGSAPMNFTGTVSAVGVWAAGRGVSTVRGEGDDAKAGGAGAVDLLVSGVPAVGGGWAGSGGTQCGGEGAI